MPDSEHVPAGAPQREPPQWHSLSANDVLAHLQSGHDGLTDEEARKRLDTYGPNALPDIRRTSPLVRFLRQFHNILIYVLVACAAITMLLGHVTDAIVILAVVVANAVIGFLQEGKAEKAINSIRQMLAPTAAVKRDGSRATLPAETLVPGDIVLIEAGDKVPADLRLLQSFGLGMQEAVLTGESVPVEKNIETSPADAALGDRTGLAFSGTLVTAGQGCGVVVATGERTEVGRISGMLADIETLRTPLVRKMEVFARWLTGVILAVSLLLLAFGYYVRQLPFDDLFMAVVGLAVAAIPEGLPAVLTICLAIGVQRMARRHAIVRRLPALETIGSVAVICTDKTGTLTRNEMQVTTLVLAGHSLPVSGSGYDPEGNIGTAEAPPDEAAKPALRLLALAAHLCNDSQLHVEQGQWTVSGDPMEGALAAVAAKAASAADADLQDWTRSAAIPFDARNRYMATLNRHEQSGRTCLFVKGAPEKLLELCRSQQQGDQTVPCDEPWWRSQTDALATAGQRVLALAYRDMEAANTLNAADLDEQLVLLGLAGLVDPPREETAAAIAECRGAGIRVKMITGDHATTAAAIGRQVGLQNPSVLTGADIDALDDAALTTALLDTDIFARTSPEHKLRLVMALQAQGLSVAMTGDGVNDAPALKRADIGIAMGRKGSEAAKEAAKLVLADDNFASIVAGIREGRTVQDNLQKVISMTLPTSIGEAMVIIAAILLGLTLPITAVQILWVNLITEVTLGLALAFEPTEPGTMQRPPRRPDAPILGPQVVWYIVLVSVLFMTGAFSVYYLALQQGQSIEHARTMVVNALVMMEIFQVFFIRNLYGSALNWRVLRATRITWILVLVVVAGQLLMTYFPPMQNIFSTAPLSAADLGLVFAAGLATFLLAEADKQLRLWWMGRRPANS